MSELRQRIACALLWLLPAALAAAEATGPVAVIHPQVREPYRAVFLAIAAGVSEELGTRAEVQEVDASETASGIAARIAAREAGTVVLLGKYGLDVSRELEPSLDRVIGAVLARPDELAEGARGISMVPSPRLLFAKLKELAPTVRRVHLVYGADDNAWLVERAGAVAGELGLELHARNESTLRDGANAYRDLLPTLASGEDAVWLLQASPFLSEASVLQMILRNAWDHNIVVFSSNVSHVPKGALFAMFPDNREMGRALGRMAGAERGAAPGLQLLEQLDVAINIRTANHLGLGLDAANPEFDMVFPSR
jgi:putative ABC transport system substrate-binding protein